MDRSPFKLQNRRTMANGFAAFIYRLDSEKNEFKHF
jgi:hypothetical protein